MKYLFLHNRNLFDREKSNSEIGTVWKRIADNVNLKTGAFKNTEK